MQQDPLTQSTEARLAAMRHHMRATDRAIRAEQLRPVPDLATLQRLAADRQRHLRQIERYEGILRSLVAQVGAPGRRGA